MVVAIPAIVVDDAIVGGRECLAVLERSRICRQAKSKPKGHGAYHAPIIANAGAALGVRRPIVLHPLNLRTLFRQFSVTNQAAAM